MSTDIIFYLVVGAMAGGFINGMSGTGTALFALGFYLVVLPPPQAVAIVALMSVLAGIQGLWIVRADILDNPKRLLRFVLPALLGIPLGLQLLDVIDTHVLRITIACFLIIYGGYFSLRAALPAFARPTPILDGVIGFASGVLGGTAGISGALPVMWLSLRPWTKSQTRAVLQPFNMTVLTTTVTLLWFKGAYTPLAVTALLITVPCGLIAAQVGIMVFRRISDTMFRRLLIVLTLILGVGLMLSELV